jgi:hypothetical protein
MMPKQTREFAACVLWTAAMVCMAFGTVESVREGHNSIALGWGIFLGLVAVVPTGWAILDRSHRREDVTVERIIEVVDALHKGRRELTRLH